MKYILLIFLLQGCSAKIDLISIKGAELHFLDGYGLSQQLGGNKDENSN